MRARRGQRAGADARLCAGPAKACQALDIDRGLSGIDLITDERLWLAEDPDRSPIEDDDIAVGPRIGVDYAGPHDAARPWRFGIAQSPSLSRPFPADR